jgi:hypothetical protein
MNIIETVQKNLGFNALKKIDPNTQETKGKETDMGNDAVAQAGIPAILLGIYNNLEQNPDLGLLEGEQQGNLLEKIFGKAKDTVVKRINEFSKIRDNHNEQSLEHIAAECMRVVKEEIGKPANETTIGIFVAKHKSETLLYLPPSLELGQVFQNENLDDRTGKMEGPVSSFMHSVEKTFNSSR